MWKWDSWYKVRRGLSPTMAELISQLWAHLPASLGRPGDNYLDLCAELQRALGQIEGYVQKAVPTTPYERSLLDAIRAIQHATLPSRTVVRPLAMQLGLAERLLR